MLPLKQGSYWNNRSKRQYWNILYSLIFHCENSVFLHTWVPVAKMLPTQQDWLLNKRFQPAVCSVCLLLQSVMCWVWQTEEGQEPDNSTFMCASSSDSEEICIGLPCARRWADVEERPGRSSQFRLLCDRSWKGCGDTQQRFMCAAHPGQYFYCYDVLSTCITLGSTGCVGSTMELQLFLDTKQLLSFLKKMHIMDKRSSLQLWFKISLALLTRNRALDCHAVHKDI